MSVPGRLGSIGVLAGLIAAPALAVGLSPLAKEGLTAGPAKAFYLTVINPYPQPREFRLYAEGEGGGAPLDILPANPTIKGEGQRRVTVILRDLDPGEIRETRICAELARQEGMIHARVCSRLLARRVAVRD
ncbi:hypothetical protein [Qipengyuania sp. MTN3-11]|uniref:hypothetical protein n=1 Tax=Qipengyuania sp. MTN3-11 TaxID=3056557 RepID=UPI0036F2EB84